MTTWEVNIKYWNTVFIFRKLCNYCVICPFVSVRGLPWWLRDKESACSAGNTGDMGLIPGLGRSSGGGNSNPFQYSCWENSMDREAWWATIHRVAKSQTWLRQLSTHTRMIVLSGWSLGFKCIFKTQHLYSPPIIILVFLMSYLMSDCFVYLLTTYCRYRWFYRFCLLTSLLTLCVDDLLPLLYVCLCQWAFFTL